MLIVTRDKRLSAPKHKDCLCSVIVSNVRYIGRGGWGRADGGGTVDNNGPKYSCNLVMRLGQARETVQW